MAINSDPSTSTFDYILPSATEAKESERLDDFHIGFTRYLEGKLALTPLGNPQRIIDIGTGSGAWAIQAAEMHPDAEVLAVDLQPLPDRPLPPNLKYQQLDVSEELPFTTGSFDVIHLRYILVHLPNYTTVMRRVLHLLKPGGIILIEDLDNHIWGVDSKDDFNLKSPIKPVNDHFVAYGADSRIGDKLKSALEATNMCGEVSEVRIRLPFSSGIKADPKLRFLAESMKRFMRGAYAGMSRNIPGITEEDIQALYDKYEDPSHEYWFDIYAIFARKI